jgi:hypothetical protein
LEFRLKFVLKIILIEMMMAVLKFVFTLHFYSQLALFLPTLGSMNSI